jgi:hypothetical protein
MSKRDIYPIIYAKKLYKEIGLLMVFISLCDRINFILHTAENLNLFI